MKLIFPVYLKEREVEIQRAKFGDYNEWRCPDEIGTQVSVFKIEKQIQPYQPMTSNFENGGSMVDGNFSNPFDGTQSKGG